MPASYPGERTLVMTNETNIEPILAVMKAIFRKRKRNGGNYPSSLTSQVVPCQIELVVKMQRECTIVIPAYEKQEINIISFPR